MSSLTLSRRTTMGAVLAAPFFGGFGFSTLIPRPYDVAIDGHPYKVDLEFKPWKREAYRHRSVDQLRAQADTANEPGEQSLNPQGLWRRTQDSWHFGAGQLHLDRKNSNEFQFRQSKGIDPWTQWQITLLPDTTSILSSANTNLALVVCGSYLYAIDGQALKFTNLLAGGSTAWTTVTGTPAVTASSICSDGGTVYVAYGASGIYSTTAGSSSATNYVSSAVSSTAVLGFVMGRLMLGTGNLLYNITGSGTLPGSPLFTSNYGAMQWVAFAEGSAVIYAAGNSGDKAVFYRIGITTDGTSLSSPVISGRLPPGETVTAIAGMVGGNVIIGTSLGVRFAETTTSTTGDENLIIGPYLGAVQGIANPVRCATGYQRFAFFGWTNYDLLSTGLGRLDPTVFPDQQTLVPAFASDLMVSGQGAVLSVTVFAGSLVFAVSGLGVYQQATSMVSSGTIDSGYITYGIADNKVPVFLDLEQSSTTGTITSYVTYDGAGLQTIGTTNPSVVFTEQPVPQSLVHTIEVREQLNLAGSQAPVLRRHTLRSIPAAATPTDITCALMLSEELNVSGVDQPLVPFDELVFLENLRQSKQVVVFQEGVQSFSVTVESLDWTPEQFGRTGQQWNGVCVVGMRTVV